MAKFPFVTFINMTKNVRNKIREKIYKYNDYVFSFKGINTKFYLPYYKEDWIQNHIYNDKNYFEYSELNYICKELKSGCVGRSINGNTVLDIGANIGNHTLYFVNECGAALSYCFEPMFSTFEMLKKNIEINNIRESVRLHNVCVGSESGKATVSSFDVRNIGGTTVETKADGELDMVSIDELTFWGRISLIKIDVEGFEIQVLKGAVNTIKNNHPIVIIEIRDSNYNESNEILASLGYRGTVISKDYGFSNYLYEYIN